MGRVKGSKNRTTGTRFKKWEGRHSNDRHVRLTHDMLKDERFQSLSGNAVRLYLYLKDWAIGKEEVEFSASMAANFMGKTAYMRARDELVSAGFIDYVNWHCAKDKRETAKFAFSDRWIWETRPLSSPKVGTQQTKQFPTTG